MKNIFVVLGVARSGTSTITRALSALGVDLGNKLTPASAAWNPKGFYEDNDIVYKINGKIFSTLNFAAYGIQLLDDHVQRSEALRDVKYSARELLQQRMASSSNWGFKDPSTVKVMAFWQDIFKELNLQDHYVISLRNPLSSAQSYKDRTKSSVGVETGLLVWLMHLIPAIENTHGKKRIVVSYELMLKNPEHELTRIHNCFPMLEMKREEIDAYKNEFLDKGLSRYTFSLDDLKNHSASAVIPLCIKTYELLLKLAKDEVRFDSAEFLSAWQEIKVELEAIFPMLMYVDAILQKNRELDKLTRTMRKSFLWKIGAPFRAFNDRIRASSRKSRNEKRILRAYG